MRLFLDSFPKWVILHFKNIICSLTLYFYTSPHICSTERLLWLVMKIDVALFIQNVSSGVRKCVCYYFVFFLIMYVIQRTTLKGRMNFEPLRGHILIVHWFISVLFFEYLLEDQTQKFNFQVIGFTNFLSNFIQNLKKTNNIRSCRKKKWVLHFASQLKKEKRTLSNTSFWVCGWLCWIVCTDIYFTLKILNSNYTKFKNIVLKKKLCLLQILWEINNFPCTF